MKKQLYQCVVSGAPCTGIKMGGFVSLVTEECVPQREQLLYKLLGFNDYSRCSDGPRLLNVVKHHMRSILYPEKWQDAKQTQKRLLEFYEQIGYYLELLLLVCYRSNLGESCFDKILVEVFETAAKILSLPVVQQIQRGASTINQKQLKQALIQQAA